MADLVAQELGRQAPVSVGASDPPRVVSDGERPLVGVELDQSLIGRVVRLAS